MMTDARDDDDDDDDDDDRKPPPSPNTHAHLRHEVGRVPVGEHDEPEPVPRRRRRRRRRRPDDVGDELRHLGREERVLRVDDEQRAVPRRVEARPVGVEHLDETRDARRETRDARRERAKNSAQTNKRYVYMYMYTGRAKNSAQQGAKQSAGSRGARRV